MLHFSKDWWQVIQIHRICFFYGFNDVFQSLISDFAWTETGFPWWLPQFLSKSAVFCTPPENRVKVQYITVTLFMNKLGLRLAAVSTLKPSCARRMIRLCPWTSRPELMYISRYARKFSLVTSNMLVLCEHFWGTKMTGFGRTEYSFQFTGAWHVGPWESDILHYEQ